MEQQALSRSVRDAIHYPDEAATRDVWLTYWQAQGQSWRTEPEIDGERQTYLKQQCAIVPNIHTGIYPFRDVRLTRADIEWLLATHENGRGPVDWNDASQRERKGLDLRGANLQGVNLCNLPLARLCAGLSYDEGIEITPEQVEMASASDVKWGDVNISVIDWSSIKMPGDEYDAHHFELSQDPTRLAERLEAFRRAVQANRQLSIVLRAQGLNEEAMRFSYRAQRLQRTVHWLQKQFGHYLFSWFLDLLAGYGYMPVRSFIAYLCVILGFALAYYTIGPMTQQPLVLTPVEAIVFSMTSFHGRGFSPGANIGLSNPVTVLAALEAFVGLCIELTFIATVTQRLFGK